MGDRTGGLISYVLSSCGATLPKSRIAFEIATGWMASKRPRPPQAATDSYTSWPKTGRTSGSPTSSFRHDLVDAEVLEVLYDRGHGQTRALEHPGAAHLARMLSTAGHWGQSRDATVLTLTPNYGKRPQPSREFRRSV
jgi:hypothetical protein